MKLHFTALLVMLGMFFCGTALAFTPPAPTGYVTDTTSSLTQSQVSTLNSSISDFNKRTQNEIAVLLIKSVGDESIEDVTQQTFKAWRVGKAGLDNGVLLIVATESRKMRLQTGKGVEGDITDIQSNDILVSMRPGLRAKDYNGAITTATGKIMNLLESRHGQKAAPGAGAQFNQPLQTETQPTTVHTNQSCNVGAVGAASDLTIFGGVAFLFVVGILLARFLIRRNARLVHEKLERDAEAELELERIATERVRVAEARRVFQVEQEAALALETALKIKYQDALAREEDRQREVNTKVKLQAAFADKEVIKSPVPRPTPKAKLVQKKVSNNEPAPKVLKYTKPKDEVPVRLPSNDAAYALGESVRQARAAQERRDEEARDEARREEERLARSRREEEERAQRRRREEEEDARRRRDEDSRRSSYESSSSSSFDWGGSSSGSGGFGGGDSGGGGSSSDW